MKLFHCNGDDNIPFENSEFVLELWTEYSNSLGIELDVTLEDGGNFDHVTCAQFSLLLDLNCGLTQWLKYVNLKI